jgi:hypothetical protein
MVGARVGSTGFVMRTDENETCARGATDKIEMADPPA